jgi:preprotein translocase subunit SecF
MDLFQKTNIDFLKYRVVAILLSVSIIAAGLVMIFTKGLRYGVDFTGGTAVHVKFRNAVELDNIRQKLKENGFADSGVQSFNDPTQVLIRLTQRVSSGDQIEDLSRRVAQILSTSAAPAGKEDLNAST